MNKTYQKEFYFFLKNKFIMLALVLSAVSAYGYQLVYNSLGPDDICIGFYFSDGFGITSGRWPYFVLANCFGIDGTARYIPFFVDFFAVILLIVGAVIWLVYIKTLATKCGIVFRIIDYTVFGCIFLSYSLVAQVWIYYLHNGIAIGYCLTGIALLLLLDVHHVEGDFKTVLSRLAVPAVLVCIATSFYESMMVVFVFGVGLYLLFEYYKDVKVDFKHIFNVILQTVFVLGIAVALRFIIIKVLSFAFHITTGSRQPRLSAVLGFFRNFFSIISGTICNYLLLPEYQPVRMFMLCTLFGVVFLVVDAFKKKRIRLLIISLLVFFSIFSITPFMSRVLPFRTMQVLSIYVGILLMTFTHKLCKGVDLGKAFGLIQLIPYIIIVIMMWNNFCEINYDFYMEYENNEYNMSKIADIGYNLEKMGYDVNEDTVYFVNEASDVLPYPLNEDMIVSGSFWDKTRDAVSIAFGVNNPVIGANYYQTIAHDLFAWSIEAFGNQDQIVSLLERKGYHVKAYEGDAQSFLAGYDIEEMPVYPEEGFISKTGNVFVVKVK